MTEDDLHRIQSTLCVSLPKEYTEFVSSGPAESRQRLADCEVFDDPLFVINETQRMRFHAPPDFQWPFECVVIGADGCGNLFCVDLREEPVAVRLWNHETLNLELLALTFGSWIRELHAE